MDTFVDDGVSLGIVVLVRHGTDLRILARGQADVVAETPMSRSHVFRIGSMTKPMVAATVLKLVERRLFSLDDTVDQWLPGLVPHGTDITIEQLLHHSSGLADYTDLPRFSSVPTGEPLGLDPPMNWAG